MIVSHVPRFMDERTLTWHFCLKWDMGLTVCCYKLLWVNATSPCWMRFENSLSIPWLSKAYQSICNAFLFKCLTCISFQYILIKIQTNKGKQTILFKIRWNSYKDNTIKKRKKMICTTNSENGNISGWLCYWSDTHLTARQ